MTINSTIIRVNDHTTRITNDNKNTDLIIYDGTGLELQGIKHDGYVPGGFTKDCNGAYSASFLGLEVEGYIENLNVNGVGYGEHVFMSLNSEDIPKLFVPLESDFGWFCHYLHFEYVDGFMNIQLCESFNDELSGKHGMIQTHNNESKWLTYNDFKCDPTYWWLSKKTNIIYPIGWNITIGNIHYKDIFIETFPETFDQELNSGHVWVGDIFSVGLMDGIMMGGVGFTEVVKL